MKSQTDRAIAENLFVREGLSLDQIAAKSGMQYPNTDAVISGR
jgi:hypothetical protein